MTGICTSPPPSARRRLLLPRDPRRVPPALPVPVVAPVAAVAAVPVDVPAAADVAEGRRAPTTRPVVREYPPTRAICAVVLRWPVPVAVVAPEFVAMAGAVAASRPQLSQKPSSTVPPQPG
jgi:hypothetical protein